MAWITPKTNWYGTTVDGVYKGDHLNASDYNRIKNNLEYLRELAGKLYPEFSYTATLSDKTAGDFFYADEFNQLENNLTLLNSKTLKKNYGTAQYFSDGGQFITYTELNRIEKACLDLYNVLTASYEGRRKFQWQFGMKGGF